MESRNPAQGAFRPAMTRTFGEGRSGYGRQSRERSRGTASSSSGRSGRGFQSSIPHRALSSNGRTRDDPEETARLPEEGGSRGKGKGPDLSGAGYHHHQSNGSPAAYTFPPPRPGATADAGTAQQNDVTASSGVEEQQHSTATANDTPRNTGLPEKTDKPFGTYSNHGDSLILNERDIELQSWILDEGAMREAKRLAEVDDRDGYSAHIFDRVLDILQITVSYDSLLLPSPSRGNPPTPGRIGAADHSPAESRDDASSSSAATIRYGLVSEPCWWSPENLSDTHPALPWMKLDGLLYRRTYQNPRVETTRDTASLDIRQVLQAKVVPTMIIPGLPVTLQRANSLRQDPIDFHLGTYPYQDMLRHRVHSGLLDDIKRVTGIKMLPPRWFEKNRYFSDRAADLKGIGIEIGGSSPQEKVSFWPLDPVLHPEPLVAALFGQADADISERTPLDAITHLENVCMDMEKLRLALDLNRYQLSVSQPGASAEQVRFSQLRFKNEILWRCCYMDSFMSRVNGSFCASFDRSFYPFLGPDIELDIWISQNGIIKPKGSGFDPKLDMLTRMYGFGSRELRYLLDDQNRFRDREVAVLERFHMLQGCLGFEQTADIAEQLKYCFYAVRNTRNTQDPHRHQKFNDRKREFDIAKLLIDQLWDDVDTKPNRSSSLPIFKRVKFGVQGEWGSLRDDEKHAVVRWNRNLFPAVLQTMRQAEAMVMVMVICIVQ